MGYINLVSLDAGAILSYFLSLFRKEVKQRRTNVGISMMFQNSKFTVSESIITILLSRVDGQLDRY